MNPKVFISHASEDKERFVNEFAIKLREKGIDAWLDRWEMLPGDSLVDKIFEEGIKEAQAIIIILSKHSVLKPWVKEELNAGLVNRIERGTKLIPVIIDDCNVPQCLKTTLWEKIANLNSYEDSFNRIFNSIIGYVDKPPLGTLPLYVNTTVIEFPNLTKIDSLIFMTACNEAIKSDSTYRIITEEIFELLKQLGIEKSDLNESLDILDRRGYIEATKVLSGDIPEFNITTYGMSNFINKSDFNFKEIMQLVKYNLVNDKLGNSEFAKKISKPKVIVDHAYNILEQHGMIRFHRSMAGGFAIYDISPELKRML